MRALPSHPFVKLSACGNDFVLVEASRRTRDPKALARRLCQRRRSLGADGLLVVSPVDPGWAVLHYEPDGERTFCLNALRAVAVWAVEQGSWEAGDLRLETDVGRVDVRPGDPPHVPLPPPRKQQALSVSLGGETVEGWWLDVGNPQLVLPRSRSQLGDPQLMDHARALRWRLDLFPAGTNVTFVAPSDQGFEVRTFERGVEDETLACGTGVVAAACAMASAGEWSGVGPTPFMTRSGEPQHVELERDDAGDLLRVWTAAPAEIVAWGELRLAG
jgi:diaminopimelate epimerase